MMLQCLSLRKDEFRLSRSTRLIKEKEYSTLTQSIEVVEHARKLSEQTLLDAKNSISELREAARREGLKAGEERSAEEILKVTKKIDNYLERVEQDLAHMVFDAVKKIVADFDDLSLVTNAIKQGLKKMRSRKQITIRVSVQLVAEVESYVQLIDSEMALVNVLPDKKLQGTDCILESDIGIVNSSVSTQLRALQKSLNVEEMSDSF